MKISQDDSAFIDANVLLESILPDRLHAAMAQDFIARHQVVISPLTAHLFTYFGSKIGLPLQALLDLLTNHKFTDLGPNEISWAIQYHQDDDFEDAMQVASAVSYGAQKFVTLDRKLAANYQAFIQMELLS